jgi:hypothetical protein
VFEHFLAYFVLDFRGSWEDVEVLFVFGHGSEDALDLFLIYGTQDVGARFLVGEVDKVFVEEQAFWVGVDEGDEVFVVVHAFVFVGSFYFEV